jgi:hypothetical protein
MARLGRTEIVLAVWVMIVVILMVRQWRRNRSLRGNRLGESSRGLLERQLAWLSDAQRRRFEQIQRGELTRKDVEIVIAAHKEDISWSDMYESIRTVYYKGGVSSPSSNATARRKFIRMANIGRESHTYLSHIVQNYPDNLASLTVFTQGSAPTRGYRSERAIKGNGHLLANSTFHDFVLTTLPTGHFVFTAAAWLPTLAQRIRRGYNLYSLTREQGLSSCPQPALDGPLGTEYKFELEDEASGLLAHVAKRCEEYAQFASSPCSGPGFWDRFVSLPRPPHDVVFFSQGSLFAVTREQILRRPLEQYRLLLKAVSESGPDPATGYFLEYFWWYVVTSEPQPCPVSGKEFAWTKNLPKGDLRDRAEAARLHPLSKDARKEKMRSRKKFE